MPDFNKRLARLSREIDEQIDAADQLFGDLHHLESSVEQWRALDPDDRDRAAMALDAYGFAARMRDLRQVLLDCRELLMAEAR